MNKALSTLFILLCSTSLYSQTSFPFLEISEASESIIKEIRYASEKNFVGGKIDGYESPKCYLTKTAAHALANVQSKLEKESLSLKVFDCYRPQQAVDHFVRWARSELRDSTKQIYFPNVPGNELFEQGYIAERSGHSRGSTVDLTIVKLPYQPPSNFAYNCLDKNGYKFRGSEWNMGTAFDCFDGLSHTLNEELNEEIQENRRLLVKAMEEEGFVNYSKEWWHFTYKPEEFPDTYFDVLID